MSGVDKYIVLSQDKFNRLTQSKQVPASLVNDHHLLHNNNSAKVEQTSSQLSLTWRSPSKASNIHPPPGRPSINKNEEVPSDFELEEESEDDEHLLETPEKVNWSKEWESVYFAK